MTERSSRHTERDARRFRVGPSAVHWDGRALHFDLNERSAPLPLKVKGRVSLYAERFFSFQAPLDAAGRHRWGPLAPSARIEVNFDSPNLSWRGHGYLDSNEGDEPVENAFESWDWARAALADGSCGVVYDARPTSGDDRILALRFNTDGHISSFDPGPRQPMARTAWGIRRQARASPDHAAPHVTRNLQDTPFYVRSLIQTSMAGERVTAMHETLDSPRLRSPLVRLMLPFRMPRRS
jgi:carotenoid 1,2-hydratase